MNMGHNQGPLLIDDGDDIRMHYARIHVSDLLNGIRTLTMEERGFYMSAFFNMYDRMGDLPADDRQAAMIIGCEVRTYRRLKARMLDLQKLKLNDGRLSNDRVEREITAYCTEAKRRRNAALEREERKRQEAMVADRIEPTSGEVPANFQPTSGEVTAEVNGTSGQSFPEVRQQVSRKSNDFNETATTNEPRSYLESWSYARALPKLKPKLKEERVVPAHTEVAATSERVIEGARDGETDVGNGLYVSKEAIRHAEFIISIDGVFMQTLNCGLSKNEVTEVCKGIAIQWALDISMGKPFRIANVANFLASSVRKAASDQAQHGVRMARAERGHTNREQAERVETQAQRMKRQVAEAELRLAKGVPK